MPGDITLTWEEWERVKVLADERMKRNNGHRFITILKTRCEYCGRSPKVRTRCGGWFQTYLDHVDQILLNLDRERDNLRLCSADAATKT